VQWLVAQRQRQQEQDISEQRRLQDREMAEQERLHSLRMAALDRRLTVHQKAYAHWWEMQKALAQNDPTSYLQAVETLYDWWPGNCLYLDAQVRDRLWRCFLRILDNWTTGFVFTGYPPEEDIGQELLKRMAKEKKAEEVREIGPLIEQAVGLPPISVHGLPEAVSELKETAVEPKR
jgi:hypothetical protein